MLYFMKLIAYLFNLKIVVLTDYEGEEYITFERKRLGSEGSWANVYPFTATGHVILRPDGTTSGKSHYVKRWKYL